MIGTISPVASAALIHAMLGPTNTGKTHYALSRMTAYNSGIIGFPLRLLARENYEKLVKLKGEEAVALLTGEEKIIPPKARWFSCTVEAMPPDYILGHKLDFVAVDEIQLAADPDRGHVFTDRLLHYRGREETLFLGAETIRPLLRKLIPNIQIETRPRLSQLVYKGFSNLSRLPPRSAIVAFSAPDVYGLAEIIRQKRGGCAVIMGRLSPRTRNAQIALYQNRDVDYLLATDAIGMGLNMDVDHVALAGLHKFDGHNSRSLTAQEIAQIAGRAGRGMKDGSFGTTASCGGLDPHNVSMVENHDFPPLKQLYWRQSHLDYTNPGTLLQSLTSKPPHRILTMGHASSDLHILRDLMTMPEIMDRAKGQKSVSLLWEICQIPDFRKLEDGSHARLCGRIFMELSTHGFIPTQWIEGQLKGLDRNEGDIDTLMHRLSAVRVCAYISARGGGKKNSWLKQAVHWQERCQIVEDRLSDALHDRLTARFVNRRTTLLLRHKGGKDQALLYGVTAEDRILVEGQEIGRISGFSLERNFGKSTMDQHTPPQHQGEELALLQKAGQRALREAMPQRIKFFFTELKKKPEVFCLTSEGILTWRDAPIAKLVKGDSFFSPSLKLLPGEFINTQQSRSVEMALRVWLGQELTLRLRVFWTARTAIEQDHYLQTTARGLLQRLYDDGGMTMTLPSDHSLSNQQKHSLERRGIIIGRSYCFMPGLLKPTCLDSMLLLYRLYHGYMSAEDSQYKAIRAAVQKGRFSFIMPNIQPKTSYAFSPLPGWVQLGTVLLRIDRLEKGLALWHTHPTPEQERVLSICFGVKITMLPDLLRMIKKRYITPTEQNRSSGKKYGRTGQKKVDAKNRQIDPASPFASLAQWRKNHEAH